MRINIKKIDYVRLAVIFITLLILFQALPVHFFADRADYLFLGKYFSEKPLEIFSPFRADEVNIHHLFHYRPIERCFWTFCYMFSGLNPISGNILDGMLFLLLVTSLYNITLLLSNNRLAGFAAALFFLSFPCNYKLIHCMGTSSLINFSFFSMALFFLFSSVINNSYFSLFIGLCCTVGALLATMNAVLIPILFLIFFLLYDKKQRGGKTIFTIGMIYMVIAVIIVFLLEQIAWKDAIIMEPALTAIHGMSVKYVANNTAVYYRIFIENSYIWFFSIGLALFLFKPDKAAFLALTWFALQILAYLPLGSASSRYFSQATGGLSIFLGVTVAGYLKEKPKIVKVILLGLIFICVFFDIGKAAGNISKIAHSFKLAKASYSKQKQDFIRLKVLAKDAVIYVDDEAVKMFYEWILRTMDREDVKIEMVDSKEKAPPELFFQGETSLVKTKEGHYVIIDKTGDWRF